MRRTKPSDTGEEADEGPPPPPPPPGPEDTICDEGPVWRYLTPNQQDAYFAEAEATARAAVLAEHLQLPEYRFDARQSILIDYAMYALDFAASLGLPPIKVSAIFTVSQKLIEALQQGVSYADAQMVLKDCFVALASPAPKADDPFLSVSDIARAGEFFADTAIRHHRLYVHVFSSQQPQLERKTVLQVETTAFVPELKAARTEDEWAAYQQQLKDEAEAAVKAAEEEAAAKAAAEKAAAEEAERAAKEAARKAELELKPATLEEAIAKMLAVRLEEEREKLAAQYKEREAGLMEKIAALESIK